MSQIGNKIRKGTLLGKQVNKRKKKTDQHCVDFIFNILQCEYLVNSHKYSIENNIIIGKHI